jgi:hypothetical protein
MRRRLEFHPDLTECTLEERFLLALPPGLGPTPFMQINPQTNQIVPSGTSQSGGTGGLSTPGPSYYYLRLGANVGFGVAGSSIGGTVSIFGLNNRPTATGGGGGGGGGDQGGGGNGTGGGNSGFGASFSSGFSFALNSANNFGTNTPTLGSVPVHTYGGGGDPVPDSPVDPNAPGNAPEGNPNPNDGLSPYPGPDNSGQVPSVDLTNRSLGKSRSAASSLLGGPGQSNNP